jgi:3-dehydroquinate dehydratase/shikimate dehydrogenase
MPTLVCVPIAVESVEGALADADAARVAGADLVEFRIDGFFTGDLRPAGATGRSPGTGLPAEFGQVLRLVERSCLPCIVTCRTTAEGGQYDGPEESRIALFEHLGAAARPPRFIDVEFSSYSRSANLAMKVNLAVGHRGDVDRGGGGAGAGGAGGGAEGDLSASLILSLHDERGRPADLSRRVLAMAAQPAAAVLKVAYRARSLRDNLELFDLLAEGAGGRPLIALAMGEFGLMSRVLAPKFGSFLTFASLRAGAATAPGQPTIDDLLNLYRFRTIGPRTRVYGVIGWPVARSLSPAMHNAAFAAAAHDGVYLPLPVPPEYEHFKATLHALVEHPRLDLAGCSVTMPHKEHLVRFAREERQRAAGRATWSIDALSELAGAANTLAVERGADGRPAACRVLNTDGPAAADLLAAALGRPLAGARLALLGAGGLARAVAAAGATAGATVTVFNRTFERAARLADQVGAARPGVDGGPPRVAAAPLERLGEEAFDAVVNCTPVGTAAAGPDGPVPADPGALRNSPTAPVVFETVSSPATTPFLARARALGLPTIDGVALLVAQAALQSAAWTGATPPVALLEATARRAAAATGDTGR